MTTSTRATSSCRASLPGNQGINWIVIKSNTAVVTLSLPELGEIWGWVWPETTEDQQRVLGG